MSRTPTYPYGSEPADVAVVVADGESLRWRFEEVFGKHMFDDWYSSMTKIRRRFAAT